VSWVTPVPSAFITKISPSPSGFVPSGSESLSNATRLPSGGGGRCGHGEMFDEISFSLEVGPIVEGDFVSARWTGSGETSDGPMSFAGNDILRVDGDWFTEYWVGTVTRS
jgi:hypothetical protein